MTINRIKGIVYNIMNHLFIQMPEGKRLVWYLAAEEYFAKRLNELAQTVGQEIEGVLFTWIVEPTVIFGRHQVMENEVNTDYCREQGIAMYRRKSGGGCVYADKGNLMISYLALSTHSEQVFQDYLDKMSACLGELGYEAVKSTHNDIMIGEHKVSGNACFALPYSTIVHGTMLYDVDFNQLQQAITPSKEKLAKHGVESVRQRVINLKEIVTASPQRFHSTEELADEISRVWCKEYYKPTTEDLEAIDAIEAEYLKPEFIYSK